MTITDETVVARSALIVASEVDGEVMMMNIERGQYFSLDEVASEVWQRLAEPRTFGSLVEQLAGGYDAPRDTIADDLRALLSAMLERDAIELR